jgi:KDO2-lipid IV(A) lauroyltransferase
MGKGFFEVFLAWWASDRKLKPLAHINGLEHYENAKKLGNGVILLSAHFASLEIGGRLLSLSVPFHVVYRPNEKPVTEHLMKLNREKHFGKAIKKQNIKEMIRSLRENNAVWYAPDQSMTEKEPLFVPFFGIKTTASTSTARLAKISSAAVVPFLCVRREDTTGYDLEIFPALESFPSGDDYEDALRINRLFEEWIKRYPSEYFWYHRRFKKLPPSEPDVYSE